MRSAPANLRRVTAEDLRAAIEATGYTLVQSWCHQASRREGDPFAILALAEGRDIPPYTWESLPVARPLGFTADYVCGFNRAFDRKPYDQAGANAGPPGSDDGLAGFEDGTDIRLEFVTYSPIPDYSPADVP